MDMLCLHDESGSPESRTRPNQYLTFWFPVFVIFFVLHFPNDQYERLFRTLSLSPHYKIDSYLNNVSTIKGFLFLYASLFLLVPIIMKIRDAIAVTQCVNRKLFIQSGILFISLVSLVTVLSVESHGIVHAQMSANPFDQVTGYHYRRIFVPALAYYLHLGDFLFIVFSLFMTFSLILVLLAWFRRSGSRLNTFQYISIFSSGFVIYQFQFPGYVEQFVLILAVISIICPMSRWDRGALVAIMLATHETAALFIVLPFILFVYPQEERRLHFVIFFLYSFLYLANFNFSIRELVHAQTAFSGTSSFQYLADSPQLAATGILFSYKLLWFLFFISACLMARARNYRLLGITLFMVFFPFLQIPLGVDTSRLLAFGYLGMLVAIAYCHERMNRSLFNAILLLNLLFPSYYVALNAGIIRRPGLYSSVYGLFS